MGSGGLVGRLCLVGAGGVEELDASSQVGDDDGAADDEGDVERFPEFVVGDAGVDALVDVVGDAVVAAEDGAGDQAEEFLGFDVEGAGFVGLTIEAEEALGDHGAARGDALGGGGGSAGGAFGVVAQDSAIHSRAIGLELLVAPGVWV